jgi:hypothetical protein
MQLLPQAYPVLGTAEWRRLEGDLLLTFRQSQLLLVVKLGASIC